MNVFFPDGINDYCKSIFCGVRKSSVRKSDIIHNRYDGGISGMAIYIHLLKPVRGVSDERMHVHILIGLADITVAIAFYTGKSSEIDSFGRAFQVKMIIIIFIGRGPA